MENFKKYALMLCLGMGSLVQAEEPQVLVTVDNKLACPAGFEVSWRPFTYGNNLLSNANPSAAHPFCKLNNGSKSRDNVLYWAAILNGSHQGKFTREQGQFTQELIRASQQAGRIDFGFMPGPQALVPGASVSLELKQQLIVEEAIQATAALNEFRRGLMAELDNFSSTGLKYGKFDQRSLSILKKKITQWNSDIQNSDFAPIYMCPNYGE